MKQYVSPKELSLAVGASESSLKRWVDEGLLHAARTAGGHRRITIEEAVRFIRQSGLRVIEPSAIGLPEVVPAPVTLEAAALSSDELSAALVEGDGPRAKGVIVAAYLAGQSAGLIMDALITPALHQIGQLWRHDAKGIFIEHRATSLCIEAINQLRSFFPAPAADAPAAVGGAMSGDIYTIPSLMAATLLAADGWHATNLGADTPIDTLLLAADDAAAKLIWVSISTSDAQLDLVRNIERLTKACEASNTKLIIGGRFAPKLAVIPSQHIHRAGSMSELAAFAAGLRAQPRPRASVTTESV